MPPRPAPQSIERQRRLAFVSLLESGRWGASEYLWSQTALRLAQDGHAVSVCTHGWRERPEFLDTLREAGVSLIERFPPRGARMRNFVNSLRNPFAPSGGVMQSRAISTVLNHRPELVLLSCTWPTNAGLPEWTERLSSAGVPYAVLIHTHAGHNWPTGDHARFLARAFDRAAAVYFVSEDNRALLLRQLGFDAARTAVVRNPLAVDREIVLPWPDDSRTRLACVGRLDPAQKGQDILIDCLRDPRWRQRGVACDFFGDGPAHGRLTELAADIPAGMVAFRGHVEKPASIWETHHFLVFPSRFEGLGLAVAEAQLCGRPVVITDCAARELVVDGETGFIAAAATTRCLQDALERAWSRRSDWPALGANARRLMLDLLPEDPAGKFAERLLALPRP